MVYEKERLIHKHAEYNGRATNNYAEYKAVLIALRWCLSKLDAKDTSVELYSDNELVVRQLNGSYKLKSKSLKPLNEDVRSITGKFKEVKFGNVRRENIYISAVDRSLNELLDIVGKQESAHKPK